MEAGLARIVTAALATAHFGCAGSGEADGSALPDAGTCSEQALPAAEAALSSTSPLPSLVFDGIDNTGAARTIALADYHEPCATTAHLLIIRVSAGFCGTCRWQAGHTRELLDLDVGSRLELLDLVVRGDDNLPATTADLAGWRARIDAPRAVAIDPNYRFDALNSDRAKLPLVVLVDTRTMTVRRTLNDPDPDQLALRVRQELAMMDRTSPPADMTSTLYDGRFTRNQRDMIAAMTDLGAPPADPTNAYADDPRAGGLGGRLFFDATLSPSGTIACASCHDPGKHWADSRPQSLGVTLGARNAPSVALASHSRWQFWDGRADSLWAQALGPFENPKEFNSSRLFVAHAVFDRYRTDYEAIFGPMPNIGALPASGKPGDASWTSMSAGDQEAVNRVFVNVGKSIAAFERTLRVRENALDAYAHGDLTALTAPQKDGLKAFFDVGCAQCHYGPRLTDDAFHVILFHSTSLQALDHGRIDAVSTLLASEFLETSSFSDSRTDTHGLAALEALTTLPSSLDGAFKTPPLRGVANTSPYAHAGSLGGGGPLDPVGLDALIGHYSGSGIDDPNTPGFDLGVGVVERWIPKFQFNGPQHKALAAFLTVLTAENQ